MRWRRVIWPVLAVLTVPYIVFISWLYIAQRQMVFVPERTATSPAEAGLPGMTTITVRTQDGLTLTGWYEPPSKPHFPTVLFFHGNGGSNRYNVKTARGFASDGYGILMAEYRGYGGNPGHPTETGLYKDANAYMHFLLDDRLVPARAVVIAGQSLGTGVAVKMASEYPASGALILLSPYTTLPAVAAGMYPYVPVDFFMRDRFDSLSLISAMHMPLLILHGEKDKVVPFALGKALYDAAPQPKELAAYPDAGHFDLYNYGAFERMIAFIEAHVKS